MRTKNDLSIRSNMGPVGRQAVDVASAPQGISIGLLAFLAVACGLAVANIYYSQPMLPLFGAYFRRTPGEVSLVTTLTQFGYAAGLLVFVPLGDRTSRKRLILTLLSLNILSLICAALAPQFGILVAASFVIGLTSVTAQIIIPMTTAIASPAQQGKVIGVLLSGLSSGILLARTLSGIVAAHAGWRAMYFVAAGLDFTLIIVLSLRMPDSSGTSSLRYLDLLGSLWKLILSEPLLRVSAMTGALTFAAYSAFWSALGFLLAKPPFGYGSDVAGLFGLVALPGIAASAYIGTWSDRRGQNAVWVTGALLVITAFVGLWWGTTSILFVCLGTLLLDLGNRACLIANQARIYMLRPDAKSRMNTVFMVSYFVGGALGSTIGSLAVAYNGWHGLAMAGIFLPVVAIIVHELPRAGSRAE